VSLTRWSRGERGVGEPDAAVFCPHQPSLRPPGEALLDEFHSHSPCPTARRLRARRIWFSGRLLAPDDALRYVLAHCSISGQGCVFSRASTHCCRTAAFLRRFRVGKDLIAFPAFCSARRNS
jgi:hypothetical protein